MNKFEQEASQFLTQHTVLSKRKIPYVTGNISTLHDKEMIEFAEWVHENCVRILFTKPQSWSYDDTEYTTSELLTIFRNQQK